MKPRRSWIVPIAGLVGLWVLCGCRPSNQQQPPQADRGTQAQPGAQQPAPAADDGETEKKTLDVSCIPEDCFLAVVVHPKQIADSPLAKEIPQDVVEELLRDVTLDLRTIQERIMIAIPDESRQLLLGGDEPGHGPEGPCTTGYGEIIRFAEPIHARELMDTMFPDFGFVQERTVAGKTYHAGWLGAQGAVRETDTDEADWPADVAVFFPDERTMISADSEHVLRKMLSASDVRSDLVQRLRQLDAGHDLAMVATARPPEIPAERIVHALQIDSWQPMQRLLGQPDLARAAVLTVNLGQDPVAELVVEAPNADSAARLKDLIDGALAAGKSLFGERRSEIVAGLPAGVGPWVAELVEQVFDNVTLAHDGQRVSATLQSPEALARLPEILALLAELRREEQRRIERCVQTPGEVGMVVIYEVASDAGGEPLPEAGMQQLLAALERRLNPQGRTSGRIRRLDDGRIEVSIFRAQPDVMQRIAHLLPRPGTLEFRILANKQDHAELIELAKADPDSRRVLDDDARLLGWWVPVSKGNEDDFKDYRGIATRTAARGGREVLEVLVVKDPFDVTGDYLKQAAADVDLRGMPCVAFTFNAAGAQRSGDLTGSNLPDETKQFYRALGIIVDGTLFSAPRIMSKVSAKGRITGRFTPKEAQDLADLLMAGSLPATIREVQRRMVDNEARP